MEYRRVTLRAHSAYKTLPCVVPSDDTAIPQHILAKGAHVFPLDSLHNIYIYIYIYKYKYIYIYIYI